MSIKYAKDYYKTLGVNKNATKKDIKKAYHRLSLEYHPDKCTTKTVEQANTIFSKISEAYQLLSDDDARKDYDKNRKDPSFIMFSDIIYKNIPIYLIAEYLAIGADVNFYNSLGQTLLMYAANRGNIELMMFLLQHNASINIVDNENASALLYTVSPNLDFNIEEKIISDSSNDSNSNLENCQSETDLNLTEKNTSSDVSTELRLHEEKVSLAIILGLIEPPEIKEIYKKEILLRNISGFIAPPDPKQESEQFQEEERKQEGNHEKIEVPVETQDELNQKKLEGLKSLINHGADIHHTNNRGYNATSLAKAFKNLLAYNFLCEIDQDKKEYTLLEDVEISNDESVIQIEEIHTQPYEVFSFLSQTIGSLFKTAFLGQDNDNI